MAASMNDPTTAGIRTSGSNPSLRPISNRTGSTRSSTSHFRNYRHALLKSNAQRRQSVEKDLPVPPVLTDGHPPPADGDATQITRPERSTSQTPTPIENSAHPTEPLIPGSADTEVKGAVENGIRSPADEYDRFHTWRLPISKIRPTVYDVEEGGEADVIGEDSSVNPTILEDAYSVENHFRHSHTNTPKVRPFAEFPSVQTSHSQEGIQETQGPASDLTDQFHSPDKEPRKEVSYWGFLPRFGEKQNNQHSEVGQQDDTPRSHGGSSYSPQVGSQRSSTGIPPTNLESDPNQGSLRQDVTNKRDSEASNGHGERKNSAGSSGKRNGELLTSIAPTSLATSNPANANDGQESLLLRRLDTSRTARWLRGLLGYSEAGNPPTLTKIPNKSPPRRESRDDVSSTVSGVTTYSNENSVNQNTMNTAMHSLEQLITEALALANEAGDRKYGHLDDGNLPLEPKSEASIRTPSIHESFRHGSSEHGGVTFPGRLSNAVDVDIDEVDDGYDILPPKSAKRPGLVKSVKRDGKIMRPSFLKRLHKPVDSTDTRYHAIDDGCVLPMPPPDCRIRRQSVYPGPLAYEEDDPTGVIKPRSGDVPNSREVREYIRIFHQPPICTRGSSKTP